MRHQRKEKKSAVHKEEEIPLHIDSLIKGRNRSVTIPDTGRFFAKQWEAMLPVVSSHVKQTGPSFELTKSLFGRFMVYLRQELRQKDKPQYENFKSSDWIAQALCNAAEVLVPDESEYKDDRLWPDGLPMSKAWQRCKNSRVWYGMFREEIFEDPGQGAELQHITAGPIQYPRVKISLKAYNDRTKLPTLTISLRGEPICLLMNPTASSEDLGQKGPDKRDAKRLWDFVSRRISVLLGIEQPTQGRPSTGLGEEAAWLRHHAGLPWPQVARKLCPQQHQHDHHCTENYKQQAKQFWKRQREKYEALARIEEQIQPTKRTHTSNKQE
jgi:hypothetical protein